MEAVLDAVKRNTKGKNEARRLRAAGRIPAVVYGAQKIGDAPAPESVSVDPKPFLRILHSASGFNTLITLKVEGGAEARVLAKNVQLDPITHHPLHADFYRVNMERKIKVTVPISLRGESRGVKVDGGVLDFVHREIEVEVLPANIPDTIEVDITNLGIGDAVHVRDLAGAASWTPVTDADLMILHVIAIKVAEEAATADGAAAAATAGAAEPEVMKKGKTDKEGDAKDAKDAKKDDKKK
ncbi:MAG TPA: 50S ribosomal protein L25 [Vicinamibacterales bacterium]|nr:50S ribosomal protein L25 [Vicinamibacterales bacterium]